MARIFLISHSTVKFVCLRLMDYRFNPKLTRVKMLKLIILLSHCEIAQNFSVSDSCAISVCEESSLCTNWTNLPLLVPVP